MRTIWYRNVTNPAKYGCNYHNSTVIQNGHIGEGFHFGNFIVNNTQSVDYCSKAYPEYHFSTTGALVGLQLSNNGLTSLPASFSQLKRIRGVDISSNPLNTPVIGTGPSSI